MVNDFAFLAKYLPFRIRLANLQLGFMSLLGVCCMVGSPMLAVAGGIIGYDAPIEGRLVDPIGVAVDSLGKVYATDASLNRVHVYDANGDFLFRFGGVGNADGSFRSPAGIAVDDNSNIWVADSANNRVQVFDSTGAFQFKIGHLRGPSDIAIDSQGSVYVEDRSNNRVQVFDTSGTFLRTIDRTNGPSIDPAGIGVDAADNLYLNNRFQDVVSYDNTGTFRQSFPFPSNFETFVPEDIEVDSVGNTFVSTTDFSVTSFLTPEIRSFNASGDLQATIFPGFVVNKFAIDSNDNFYLTQAGSGGGFIRVIDKADLLSRTGNVITRRDYGPFRFLESVTEGIGVNFDATRETAAETFIVPGVPGTPVDLEFKIEAAFSGFSLTFGFYDLSQASSDPINQRPQFAQEAISPENIIFDETAGDGVGDTHTITIDAGTEIGFFLYSGRTRLDNFLQDPDRIYDIAFQRKLPGWLPHFSQSDANPGEFDQMLAFVDAEKTYFGFEDLAFKFPSRNFGFEFGDFTDLFVSVNAPLITIPEPTAMYLAWIGTVVGYVAWGRPRRTH